MDETDGPLRLPTDLSGINVAMFRLRPSGDALAGLAPAAMQIRDHISRAMLDAQPKAPDLPEESYTCFISYSFHDKEFAERIYDDLRDVGIRCWLDSKDLKIGDNIGISINRAIRLTDKVLLVLSRASANSRWVRREVEFALKREAETKRTVLFPIRIDDAVMKTNDPYSRILLNSKHIGNFTDWTDANAYKSAFSRLVKDLAVSAAAEQDRTPSNA
jgi:hypothetical protein